MKNNRKIVSALLIGTMCMTTMPVFANTKDETVYTKLNNNSESYSTIVSDKLSNDNNDEFLKDITDLLNLENTNGDEKFSQDGENITWEAQGKNIQYRGETNKSLPVTCHIKYELDGNEVEAKDIVGKTGKVKITLEYTNNEVHTVKVNGKNVKMYTPFVVVAGTIFDNTENSNIKISSGKVIENGNKTIAIGLAVPGMQESLGISSDKFNIPSNIEFEMDAKDFEMNNIVAFATPKLLETEDLKMFDELDKIYSQVNTLQSSSRQLVDGANQVKDGAKQLDEGANTLKSGISVAYNGASTIKTAVAKSTNSLLNDKSDALDSKTLESIGVSASKTALATISSQSEAIGSSAKEQATETIKKQLSSIGTSAKEQAQATIKEQLSSIGTSAKKQATESMKEQLSSIGKQAETEAANVQLTDKQIAGIKAQVKANLEKDSNYIAMSEDMQAIILQYSQASAVSAAKSTVTTTAKQVANKTAQSTAMQVAGSVAEQTAQNAAMQVAGNIAEQTAQSTASQVAGSVAEQTAQSTAMQVAQSVANQTAKTVAGTVANQVKGAALSQVASQMSSLTDGLTELTSGLAQLNEGAGTLTEGTSTLADGSNTLAEGMNKFDQEGIEKIANYINGDVKDLTSRLEALKKLSEEYKTFTKINDGDKGSVKFIMITDSLKKENYTQNTQSNENAQNTVNESSRTNKENETSGEK